jgi:hypothetical protein
MKCKHGGRFSASKIIPGQTGKTREMAGISGNRWELVGIGVSRGLGAGFSLL